MLGSIVVMGICGYYLLRKRNQRFAIETSSFTSKLGLVAALFTIVTGHISAGPRSQLPTYEVSSDETSTK